MRWTSASSRPPYSYANHFSRVQIGENTFDPAQDEEAAGKPMPAVDQPATADGEHEPDQDQRAFTSAKSTKPLIAALLSDVQLP
jgi:hypothetical protein